MKYLNFLDLGALTC